jgi:hypothetical protein
MLGNNNQYPTINIFIVGMVPYLHMRWEQTANWTKEKENEQYSGSY